MILFAYRNSRNRICPEIQFLLFQLRFVVLTFFLTLLFPALKTLNKFFRRIFFFIPFKGNYFSAYALIFITGGGYCFYFWHLFCNFLSASLRLQSRHTFSSGLISFPQTGHSLHFRIRNSRKKKTIRSINNIGAIMMLAICFMMYLP